MNNNFTDKISQKLIALGVKKGANNLPRIPKSQDYSIERIVPGQNIETPQGKIYRVEKYYTKLENQNSPGLLMSASLDQLAKWTQDERVARLSPEEIAFIDTETTGLSGGTGTYAFLIGVGRYEKGDFYLTQFFMRNPTEEPAQLFALEDFLAPCKAIVSFNGKAFDLPLLFTRYITHGWQAPFNELAHIDLLHLARRLWSDRLSSRTLGNLEVQILGTQREDEDIPGWMIPSLYFDYLQTGDARPLRNVFYHNAVDVFSMSGLLNHMVALLSHPLDLGNQFSVDLLSLAKLFEDMGDLETATELYIHGLNHDDITQHRLPDQIYVKALQRLAQIYKRQNHLEAAIRLWKIATYYNNLDAYVELAKCYEHRYKEYPEAIRWTEKAIDSLSYCPDEEANQNIYASYQVKIHHSNLEHRLKRLYKKNSRKI